MHRVRDVVRQTWRRTFPDLDFETAFVAIFGAAMLVLCIYHGRPHQLAEYFPGFEQGLGEYRSLAWHLYSHAVFVVFLMLLPVVALKWPLRRRIQDHGLRWASSGRELKTVALLFVAVLPLLVLVCRTEAFQAKYPKLHLAGVDPGVFVVYELAYLVKWTAWEFFFRGFLLFGLRPGMGDKAVVASTLPFVLAHIGKPEAEILGAIVAGFVLCGLALRSRSIVPGVLLHFGVAATVDALTSDWWG